VSASRTKQLEATRARKAKEVKIVEGGSEYLLWYLETDGHHKDIEF
jgi:hypothetical protein